MEKNGYFAELITRQMCCVQKNGQKQKWRKRLKELHSFNRTCSVFATVCADVCNVRHKHRRLRKEHGYKNEGKKTGESGNEGKYTDRRSIGVK